ncbi:Protein of unknown function, partial [Gryllus bimaculatus]
MFFLGMWRRRRLPSLYGEIRYRPIAASGVSPNQVSPTSGTQPQLKLPTGLPACVV